MNDYHYKMASGILLLCDMSNSESSLSSLERWIDKIKKKFKYEVAIVLVGTKSDLLSKIPFKNLKAFARKMNISLVLKSAKINFGIDEAFKKMIQKLLNFSKAVKSEKSLMQETKIIRRT